MTKMYILYKNGSMYYDSLKPHGLTWIKVNEVRADYCYKETADFLKKYGLKPTIYNVANYQKYGKIVLPKPIAKRIIREHKLDVIE